MKISKNELNELIEKIIDKQLFKKSIVESPDGIRAENPKFNLLPLKRGTYPFGYYMDLCYIGPERSTHPDIFKNYRDDTRSDRIKKGYFHRFKYEYPGRVGTVEKIISFWEYPNKLKFNRVISDINKESKIKDFDIKIDGSGGVEIIVDKNKTYSISKINKNWTKDALPVDLTSTLIKLKDFTSSLGWSKEELEIVHMMPPERKKIKRLLNKTKRSKRDQDELMKYYKDKDLKNHPEFYEQIDPKRIMEILMI